jgi:ABC-type ATPase with predicted acetyltransferase domain
MVWTEELKERINRFATKNPDARDAEKIRNNPKYANMLEKLEVLYDQRNMLAAQLEKVELNIDACLLLAAMNEKKEEIDNNIKSGERINQ